MQSLSMFSMGFHWQTGLLRATHPGTFHAFTTIKEKEKACLLLFLIPSPTPSKTLQHKTDPLNPHQLPARSILETLVRCSRAAVFSSQKTLLLDMKSHLSCTGPGGISCFPKGHVLMRMHMFQSQVNTLPSPHCHPTSPGYNPISTSFFLSFPSEWPSVKPNVPRLPLQLS